MEAWYGRLGRVCAAASAALVILMAPAVVWAQATITGTVKDTSGALLPGVTVEASSPVLIEKSSRRRQRRHGAVPHRESAPRHVHGDVRADRVQHGRA